MRALQAGLCFPDQAGAPGWEPGDLTAPAEGTAWRPGGSVRLRQQGEPSPSPLSASQSQAAVAPAMPGPGPRPDSLEQDVMWSPSDFSGQGLVISLRPSFPFPQILGAGRKDSRGNYQATRQGRATRSPGRSWSPGGTAGSRAAGRPTVAARPCHSPGPSCPLAPARHPARAALGAEDG